MDETTDILYYYYIGRCKDMNFLYYKTTMAKNICTFFDTYLNK